MSSDPQKFYLTTPIYYVNARPHLGHAYTTLVADVVARRHRLLGHDTWFLTGTDEHGQKIERSATAAGMPPQQFADEVSASFQSLWKRMGITNDDYIRTTEPRHKQGVQKLFQLLCDRDAIYKGTYTGQYCVSDEAYVEGPPGVRCPDCGRLTETVSEENYYFRLSDYQQPLLDLIESDTLRIQPDSRRNEVLSFLRGPIPSTPEASSRPERSTELSSGAESSAQVSSRPERSAVEGPASPIHERPGAPSPAQSDMGGNDSAQPLPRTAAGTPYLPGALKDLSISRTSFSWGIPVPGDEKHVIYVWLDALANYMTAVGYGSEDPELQARFARFWPADLHLVGKEIIRFHCVYWPAFLLALDPDRATAAEAASISTNSVISTEGEAAVERPAVAFSPAWAATMLPRSVVAHGWLLFEESKMSKSRGNIVRSETILDSFGDHYRQELVRLGQPEPTRADADLFATDVLRYFLLREIPFGQDGSFSFDAMITRYNADLANGYGNLVSRTLSMIAKSALGVVPEFLPVVADGEPVFVLTAADPEHVARSLLGLSNTLHHLIAEFELALAMQGISNAISAVDSFLSDNAPWKLAKDPAKETELHRILYTAAESIRILTALLYPILPYSTAKVWSQLGLGDIEQAAREGRLANLEWGGLQPGTRLGPLAPIFPRAPKELAQTMADIEASNAKPAANLQDVATDEHDAATANRTEFPQGNFASVTAPAIDQLVAEEPTSPAAPPRTSTLPSDNPGAHVGGSSASETQRPATPSHVAAEPSGVFASPPATTPVSSTPADPAPASAPQITIDDFAKVELRVARILVAERIPKADKLLRLEVDLGSEQRQILSGIAEWYTPEDLVGRKIVVITNLAPRKMRGLESHGMLLAASDGEGGKPVLATFAEDIPVGSRLK